MNRLKVQREERRRERRLHSVRGVFDVDGRFRF
jgi:hypothetical protein